MKNCLFIFMLLGTFGLNAQKTPAKQASNSRDKLTCLDQYGVAGAWQTGYPASATTFMGALIVQLGGTKHYILKPYTYTIQGSSYRIENGDISVVTNPSRCGMSPANFKSFLDGCNANLFNEELNAESSSVNLSSIPLLFDNLVITERINPITAKDSFATTIDNSIDAKIVYITEDTMRCYFLANEVGEDWVLDVKYFYQESYDNGKTWHVTIDTAFFDKGPPGATDEQLWEFTVIPDTGTWLMYYQGAKFDAVIGGKRFQTHLATSIDEGINWTRQGVVMPHGKDAMADWDGMYAGVRSIWKYNNLWYMYYEGNNADSILPATQRNSLLKLGLATSKDGITFTKQNGDGFIMGMDSIAYPWETSSMLMHVEIIDSVFVCLYGNNAATDPNNNSDDRAIGIATSLDGINFIKYDGNPIINMLEFTADWNGNRNCMVQFGVNPKGGYFITTRGNDGFPWDSGLLYLNKPDKYQQDFESIALSFTADANNITVGTYTANISFPSWLVGYTITSAVYLFDTAQGGSLDTELNLKLGTEENLFASIAPGVSQQEVTGALHIINGTDNLSVEVTVNDTPAAKGLRVFIKLIK